MAGPARPEIHGTKDCSAIIDACLTDDATEIMPPSLSETSTLRVTLIAALAKNRAIGINNTLPWRLPEDLKHFKALTLGHPIIMGRKTWDSIGRPLPGRTNIVISRSTDYAPAGALLATSLDAALRLALDSGAAEAFVIGGADIYRQSMPFADCLQLTEIDHEFAADTFFPSFDAGSWQETARESHRHEAAETLSGTENPDVVFDYAFVTYERR